MLNTESFDKASQSSVPGSTTNPTMRQAVDRARACRLRDAEIASKQGTCEITVSVEGTEISSVWSDGTFVVLGREFCAGALSRAEFISDYVHADDRELVLSASLKVMRGGADAKISYRIMTHAHAVVYVSERIGQVAACDTVRIVVCALQRCEEHTGCPEFLARLPAPLRFLCEADAAVPAIHALIAAFDALKDGEQRRLAREMHDDFGQVLAAMKLDLTLLRSQARMQGPMLLSQVANLQELVDGMIVSTRRVLSNLPPRAVEESGLFTALEHLVQGFRKRHALNFHTRLCDPETYFGNSLEVSIYRIVQEALSNVVRHANASNVWICASLDATHLHLQIRDDGRGASAAELRRTASFGVLWMQERVFALGGTIDIESRSHVGTCIRIAIPARISTRRLTPS